MDQQKLKRRYGYESHTVIGQVGKLHILSSKNQSPVIVLTLEESLSKNQADKNFYQIVLSGQEALTAFQLGFQSGDEIVLTIDELKAKGYLDQSHNPPQVVPYFEARGRDAFILRRPGSDSDLPDEPFNLDPSSDFFDDLEGHQPNPSSSLDRRRPSPEEKALAKKKFLNKVRLNLW
ncbi:MAG: hypothetical protein LBE80_09695 [Deltaproteobacteria bacterium]|jgi:hypothetical protein|nr:hypothetical protein [Deltaproteobacteria bacterium]